MKETNHCVVAAAWLSWKRGLKAIKGLKLFQEIWYQNHLIIRLVLQVYRKMGPVWIQLLEMEYQLSVTEVFYQNPWCWKILPFDQQCEIQGRSCERWSEIKFKSVHWVLAHLTWRFHIYIGRERINLPSLSSKIEKLWGWQISYSSWLNEMKMEV